MKHWNQASAEHEIRRLKSDLLMARRAIIELMPDEIGHLLRGYYSCTSRIEGDAWKAGVVDSLIERAIGSARPPNVLGEQRSMCPLCGQGSSSPYVEGYSLPEGLRRHLVGWGNTHPCIVMETAFNLARDYWTEAFAAAEQEARIAAQAIAAKRRQTETLYRVSPDGEPKLLDEGNYSWSPSRTPEQIALAEERLKSLGFQCLLESNIQSWVDERADCVVYADLRQAGKLQFEVWRKPLPKRISSNSRRRHMVGSFHLLDSLKKDLLGKYADRLNQSLT